MVNLHNLFPIPVGFAELGRPLSDEELFFIRELPTRPNMGNNSESWWFEATAGKLILFPSSLTHMVPEVKGDDVRISLSFNTFPVGVVGEEMDLTGLKLEV
jgi:hypothetical protein